MKNGNCCKSQVTVKGMCDGLTKKRGQKSVTQTFDLVNRNAGHKKKDRNVCFLTSSATGADASGLVSSAEERTTMLLRALVEMVAGRKDPALVMVMGLQAAIIVCLRVEKRMEWK